MQIVCISLQADNRRHLATQFFTGYMLFLMPNQQYQSTGGSQSNTRLIAKKCLDYEVKGVRVEVDKRRLGEKLWKKTVRYDSWTKEEHIKDIGIGKYPQS